MANEPGRLVNEIGGKPRTDPSAMAHPAMPRQRSLLHVLVWVLPPLALLAVLAFPGL